MYASDCVQFRVRYSPSAPFENAEPFAAPHALSIRCVLNGKEMYSDFHDFGSIEKVETWRSSLCRGSNRRVGRRNPNREALSYLRWDRVSWLVIIALGGSAIASKPDIRPSAGIIDLLLILSLVSSQGLSYSGAALLAWTVGWVLVVNHIEIPLAAVSEREEAIRYGIYQSFS